MEPVNEAGMKRTSHLSTDLLLAVEELRRNIWCLLPALRRRHRQHGNDLEHRAAHRRDGKAVIVVPCREHGIFNARPLSANDCAGSRRRLRSSNEHWYAAVSAR